jgi:pseudouridine kinase
MLTEREQQIIDLLRHDPLMGSAELAEKLGTTRGSINVHLSNLGKKGAILGRGYVLADSPGAVVIGGSNMDLKARSSGPAISHTSNPGHGSMTPGGVGRNIAEMMARLGDRVHLISVVGRDSLGENLMNHTAAAGVWMDHVVRTESSTGTYTAVLDANGELVVAIADMEATAELGPAQLQGAREVINNAELVVVDGNLTRAAVDHALDLASGTRTILEPVSVPKAARLKDAVDERVYAVTPNRDELGALTDLPIRTDKQVTAAIRTLHDRGVELVWVRLGKRGSMLSTGGQLLQVPALPTEVVDVTGAGDSALAGFCHVLLAGGSPEEAARFGHAAAALTISSNHTVRPDLTVRLIKDAMKQEESR